MQKWCYQTQRKSFQKFQDLFDKPKHLRLLFRNTLFRNFLPFTLKNRFLDWFIGTFVYKNRINRTCFRAIPIKNGFGRKKVGKMRPLQVPESILWEGPPKAPSFLVPFCKTVWLLYQSSFFINKIHVNCNKNICIKTLQNLRFGGRNEC